MEIKTIIKYSLIYTLLTTFLSKAIFLIFNYQYYSQIGYLELFFNSFVFSIAYIVILVIMFNKAKIQHKNSFSKILIIAVLTLFITYTFKYITELLFYYLNTALHTSKVEKNDLGLIGLSNSIDEIFFKPSFSIINNLFIHPYYSILTSFRVMSIKAILLSIFNSKIIQTTLVMYYFSLFHLFKTYNEKGIDAIIPIKNNLTLLKITNKPIWWILPVCLPFIRLIPRYLINLKITEKFNKTQLFAIGMTLLPWFFYGKIALNEIKLTT